MIQEKCRPGTLSGHLLRVRVDRSGLAPLHDPPTHPAANASRVSAPWPQHLRAFKSDSLLAWKFHQ
jgi:hypothetical protein